MKTISSSRSLDSGAGTQPKPLSDAQTQRRKFLLQCGRYGAVTPPAIALLLAGGTGNYAVARSGAGPAGWGGSDPSPVEDPPTGGGGGGGAGGGTFQDAGALNTYQRGGDLPCDPQVGNPACDSGGGQSIGDSTRIGPIKP